MKTKQKLERRDRSKELAMALGCVAKELVEVGLGDIKLGCLAKHMLKLKKK